MCGSLGTHRAGRRSTYASMPMTHAVGASIL
jgi:hypothetical protein